MGKQHSTVECTQATFLYPQHIETQWQIESSSGKSVDLLLMPTTPDAVIPFMLHKVVPPTHPAEFDLLAERMRVKPQNIYDFFVSNCCELEDGLTAQVSLTDNKICYDANALKIDWIINNQAEDTTDSISYHSTLGKEITMEDFQKTNQRAITKVLSLSKRDTRKLFVVTKKIIKLFPRILSKNTPIRGLYTPSATPIATVP